MARTLIAALGALALLTGCGGGDDDRAADTAGAAQPIVVSLSAEGEELELYQELARAYEAAGNPKVTVNGIADRTDFLAKLTTSFAAKRPPDAFLINHRYLGGYAQRGVLEPVGARLGDAESDFYPVALDAFRVGGELMCVPQNASSLVVYYNTSLFKQAGIPAPAGGWTLEELRAAAQALTGGGVHGVGLEPAVIRAAPFVWSAGGELVDDQDAPTRFTLDTPEARTGLEAMLSLAEFGPSLKEAESKPLDERFLSGELAMFLSSRREVPTFRTITDFEWDVAPLPALVDGTEPTTVLHSDGWCLPKGSRADAAWKFIRFATGEEGGAILSRGGRTVPSLRAAAQSPVFLDSPDPPASNQVFIDALDHMQRLPTVPNWERVEESANLALEQAFYGGLSLDEALERIAAETEGGF
jgi:multiple sugar transport system substrate-binding protein